MDLFQMMEDDFKKTKAPLASRIRPKTLDEFIGQEKVIGKNTLLYRAIKGDRISSLILYGPAGTGKTTLAKIIANTTKSEFISINATNSGIKDIKENIEIAKQNISTRNSKTILFIDEIHRFNKAQQDALLPHVEEGIIVLIGATTENPYFEVNTALVSRSTIIQLEPLTCENIKFMLERAIKDKENGLGHLNVQIEDEALDFLSNLANGDGRVGLNALELAVITTDPDSNGNISISLEIAKESIQKKYVGYDKNGDNHYNTISAFIKSMRGSDPDAAVYYLSKMIYAGEDPKFIARRIVIFASEDIGLADSNALSVAVSAFNAVNLIGMPESKLILSHAVLYMALAPKSNSATTSIVNAMADVKNIPVKTIPTHLKDAHYSGAKDLGHIGYKYPHEYKNHYVKQQYLPDELVDRTYYNGCLMGKEKEIVESYLERIKNV